MRHLFPYKRIMLLLLVLTGFAADVYSIPIPMPTTRLLRQVVLDHYYAIGENRIDEAMGYYHSQSPDRTKTRENIEYGFSQYLLRTTTMDFCYIGEEGEFAVATAKHRYLMISGIKFMDQITNVIYRLREENGSWKIWAKRDGPVVSSGC